MLEKKKSRNNLMSAERAILNMKTGVQTALGLRKLKGY